WRQRSSRIGIRTSCRPAARRWRVQPPLARRRLPRNGRPIRQTSLVGRRWRTALGRPASASGGRSGVRQRRAIEKGSTAATVAAMGAGKAMVGRWRPRLLGVAIGIAVYALFAVLDFVASPGRKDCEANALGPLVAYCAPGWIYLLLVVYGTPVMAIVV